MPILNTKTNSYAVTVMCHYHQILCFQNSSSNLCMIFLIKAVCSFLTNLVSDLLSLTYINQMQMSLHIKYDYKSQTSIPWNFTFFYMHLKGIKFRRYLISRFQNFHIQQVFNLAIPDFNFFLEYLIPKFCLRVN